MRTISTVPKKASLENSAIAEINSSMERLEHASTLKFLALCRRHTFDRAGLCVPSEEGNDRRSKGTRLKMPI